MSVITNNTIQPSSGQPLTIKDEGGTASITVATNGEATFAENIKITANKGINFSAYATVTSTTGNTLNDYEEGVWSITDGSGASLSLTTASDSSFYVKIGRLVTCCTNVSYPSTGDGNMAQINLPFSATPNGSAVGGVLIEQNIDSGATFTGAIDGGNKVRFRERGSSAKSNANLSGKNLRFILTYFTTD